MNGNYGQFLREKIYQVGTLLVQTPPEQYQMIEALEERLFEVAVELGNFEYQLNEHKWSAVHKSGMSVMLNE